MAIFDYLSHYRREHLYVCLLFNVCVGGLRVSSGMYCLFEFTDGG